MTEKKRTNRQEIYGLISAGALAVGLALYSATAVAEKDHKENSVDGPKAGDFASVQMDSSNFSSSKISDVVDGFLKDRKVDLEITPVLITYEPSTTQSKLWTALISTSGYQDDSLAGENFRLEIVKQDGNFELVDVGIQYVCARGETAGQPQTDLCP